ncbi:hypothetical protein [Liquorilactobacillus mali]|uniref:hypothetical protein n=1 Tax=Liquorilactobacillus mali TaxID=1618 RepID=UPI002350249B|nr:hypothetical protein [Liquorilactobacillus mali]MDC7953442.1 hypothetical protein [Liquorilactobacillus mali]MDV7757816.1 hypothetical protein [Liquorilactobacillus mali]
MVIEPGQTYRRTGKERYTNEPGKGVSRYLVFFIGIALMMSAGTYALKNTILNVKVAVSEVTKTVYVKQATATLNSVVATLASQNNIPSSLTSNLVTKSQVKTDLASVTRNIYAGKSEIIDSALIKKQIEQNLTKKAESAGISTDSAIYQSAQNTFLSEMSSYITSKISATPAAKLAKVIANVKKTNNLIFIIGIISFIVLSLLLIIHDRNIFRIVYYWGISAIWSGIFLAATAFLIGNSEIPNKIASMADQASGLIGTLLQITFDQVQSYGLLLIGIGAVLFILGLLRRIIR